MTGNDKPTAIENIEKPEHFRDILSKVVNPH